MSNTKTTLMLLRFAAWMVPALDAWGAEWVKWLNPAEGDNPFHQKVIGRIWTDDIDADFIGRGEEGGSAFVQHMLPRWRKNPWVYAWELANEPLTWSPEHLRNLNDYSLGAMREAERQGIRLCILNIAEGNPGADKGLKGDAARASERWKLEQLVPAVRWACDKGHLVGMHAYWRPGVEGPLGRWHSLGRRIWDVQQWEGMGVPLAKLQYFITETGIDGGVEDESHPKLGGKGWRSLSNLDTFSSEVVTLETEAQKLPWLKAMTLFIANHEGWQDFDITKELAAKLSRSFPVAKPVPLPEPEPEPEPEQPTPISTVPGKVTALGVEYREYQLPVFHSQRPTLSDVSWWVVIHDTEGPKQAAFAWWNSKSNPYKSSAHDLIDTEGFVWRVLSYRLRAHHAGYSHLPGFNHWDDELQQWVPNANDVSIGIELEYPAAPANPPWPAKQWLAAILHVRELVRVFKVPPERLVRHKDIDPTRRTDPRNFAWEEFKRLVYMANLTTAELTKQAFASMGVDFNPNAALWRKAQEAGLGLMPLKPEYDFVLEGTKYRMQLYPKGLVVCEIGHWDEVQVVRW
jgi:N-acetyl-anhydromuramyl-L-alanine amidase AmpD